MVAPQQQAGGWRQRQQGQRAAWGLRGLVASPEEEGAGPEAGEWAGMGRLQGLAAATWLVGQGWQGLDQAGSATCPGLAMG